MKVLVVDPFRRSITKVDARSPSEACRRFIGRPWGCDDMTDEIAVMYCPFGFMGIDARFLWSNRMGEFYAGNVLVFGRAIDGGLVSIDPENIAALEEDILFLGGAAEAKAAIVELADTGAIRAYK